jgi:hypothetical protein
MEQLEPALKEIFTLVSHTQYGRYLRRYAADFVIQDYINFISRRNPAGKSYWEGYNDGPRKHSFAHCQCSCGSSGRAQRARRSQAVPCQPPALRA